MSLSKLCEAQLVKEREKLRHEELQAPVKPLTLKVL